MINYMLRRVDPALWREVKAKAAAEGRTVRFVLIELLRIYAKWGFRVIETFDGQDR